MGPYAMERIKRDSILVEYRREGIDRTTAESPAATYMEPGIREEYILIALRDLVMDATVRGNRGRYVYHY